MAEEELPIIKIVVIGIKANSLGESGVGKSNIISRYAFDKFSIGLNATIGLEFVSKNIKLEGADLRLEIWDTAGQERYRALNRTFYRNSMGAVIVFSLGDKKSFMNIKRWKDELKEHTMENLVVILVGNKCDLKDREVTVDEASKYAQQEKMAYLEASAALNIGIDKIFEMLSNKIYLILNQQMKKKETQAYSVLSAIEDEHHLEKRKKKCCE